MTRLPILTVCAVILLPFASRADTYTVVNTADSGAGSLRQAIVNANSHPGDDTILFDGPLDGLTIGISSGDLLINDNTGKTAIDASALSNGVSVSPSQNSRILFVTIGSVVEIKNLTLRDGMTAASGAFGETGGAIQSFGDLTLVDCTVTGNQTAYSAAGSNSSGSGGAVYSGLDSSFTAIDTVFSNNRTGDSDSTEINQRKTGRGGAIYADVAVSLTRCSFDGNKTGSALQQGDSGEGGAVFCTLSELIVEDCTFENNETGIGFNESGHGGAIGVSGTDASLTVRDSEFISNLTGGVNRSGNGGAIAHGAGGSLIIERSEFSMNQTGSTQVSVPQGSGRGGALDITGAPFTSISDSTFAENHTGTGTEGGNGGAIYLQSTDATVSGCAFTGNYTGDGRFETSLGLAGPGGRGGAIFNLGNLPLILTDCDFNGNYTGDAGDDSGSASPAHGSGGGAIYNTHSMTAKRCTFKSNLTGTGASNTVPGGHGGAIWNHDTASCVLENCTLAGNQTAPNSFGGAVCWQDGATGILLNCTVTGNSAPGPGGQGGGLWSNSLGSSYLGIDDVEVDNSIIAENTAVTGPDLYENAANTYLSASATPKNLIGINNGAAASFPAGPLIGTSGGPVVPELEVLADNGGHTLTRDPVPGGNVVDAGDSAVAPMPSDQRDTVRIFASAVDLGSVEYVVAPGLPTGLTATNAETGVMLSWTAGSFTDSYRIFRHSEDDITMAVEIGTSMSAAYLDDSTAPGVVYFYWVTAVNAVFESGPIGAASGNRLPPSVPTGLGVSNAADGTIALAWTAVTDADGYRVYRSNIDDPVMATAISTPAGNSYNDASGAVGDIYYYWLKTVIDGYESDFSAGAMGKRLHPAVGNVMATDAFFDDLVRVTWDGVPGVDEYVIYRNTVADLTGATEIGRVASDTLQLDDQTANPGTVYFYGIRPEMADGEEAAISQWTEGERSAAITFRPDLRIGKRATSMVGDGIYNSSGAGQTAKTGSKRRKALKIYLRVEADGAQPDTVKVLGTRRNRKFKASYFGPGNITAAVIRGDQSFGLASGAGAELKLVTKRKGKKTGRFSRKSFRVTGTSTIVPARADTALGKVSSR